ncbi:integral membrane protein [Streptomyces laurentii]|uniref:Integral membrane protein n=1 Tax=Streptomyces laurentii TaxID=39478 RepID=A0A169PHG6_STRLU|nr:integral membrane protein [Streptomyces laurentii]
MAQADRPTGTDSGSLSRGTALPARRDRLLRLGAPSVAATVLTATVALYMALVAFGNITDFGTNQQFVQHVLSMDTTFKDPDLMWRAVESRALQNAAYVAVIVWEALAALVLLAATWFWITGLRRDAYDRARAASTVGLVMVLLLFGMGFLAIGGEWFAMWQSSDWNGLDAAARNVALAAFTLLVVYLPAVRRAGAERT